MVIDFFDTSEEIRGELQINPEKKTSFFCPVRSMSNVCSKLARKKIELRHFLIFLWIILVKNHTDLVFFAHLLQAFIH